MSFEKIRQDNFQQLAVREGQSLQLCVVIVSGSLPYEELFTVFPELTRRKKRGNFRFASKFFSSIQTKMITILLLCRAAFLTDYTIKYPIERGQQLYLGPDLNRSCINITAIDDNVFEDTERLHIQLREGEKSNARVINSEVDINIVDDDSK